ncbi:MAG TPA: hypothetical protein VFO16_18535 [Pseudonocardiaceae bacterium]|nr:hypothetical protein [Pseudonocardiaceae bacterium]
MDLLAALRIALRRWYILIPLIALTALGGLAVRTQIKPSWEVDGLLPIVTPYVSTQEASDQLKHNTLIDAGGTSTLMGLLGDSPEVRQAVEKRGGDANYVVSASSGSITVKIKTDSVARALATYQILRDELNIRLDALQRSIGVPGAYRATISDALAPTGGLSSNTGRTRAMLGSLGLGIALSFATCVFADYLLTRRRPGRHIPPWALEGDQPPNSNPAADGAHHPNSAYTNRHGTAARQTGT